jgi:nucleoside-diphosphate-sugar epimerase
MGSLGMRAVKLLASEGHEVTTPVGSKAQLQKAKALGAKPQLLNPLIATDMDAALYGQEAVINLSGEDDNSRAWIKNPARLRAISLNLARGALRNRIGRFIQESTVFLYADRSGDWIEEGAHGKTDASASTALLTEKHVMDMQKGGVTPVILRFAGFYSSDNSLTRKILRWTRFGFYLERGMPEGYMPRVHLDDAASALQRALHAPAGIWNISEDEPSTRRQSSQALSQILGRKLSPPSTWTALLLRAGPPPCRSLRISNHKFKEATGWQPAFPSPMAGWSAVVAQAKI